MTQDIIGHAEAVAFLNEAAAYFERRPTNGEDRAHWANVYNAENCRKIAALLTCRTSPHPEGHMDRDGQGNARFVPPGDGE